jgi:hypothetical protein
MYGLYKALAEVANASGIPKELRGNMTMRRAVVGSADEGYRINAAMSLQHSVLVLDTTIFDELTTSVVVTA